MPHLREGGLQYVGPPALPAPPAAAAATAATAAMVTALARNISGSDHSHSDANTARRDTDVGAVKQELGAPLNVTPNVSLMEHEAVAQRNRVEREVIAKFTGELEQANSFITMTVDQANRVSGCVNSTINGLDASTIENQKKFCMASIRNVADLMHQLKPACEECLSMLQQAQTYPMELRRNKPWAYISYLKQVDKFQAEFEHVFWTGIVSCQPEQYSLNFLRDITGGLSKFHAAVLKLCSTGKCEIAGARNKTFGEYCTISMATLKVFYVLIMESTQKIAEMKPPPSTVGAPSKSPHNSAASTQLAAPVLEVPALANVTSTGLPQADCLKLLRSLSSEIVLPRSISNEILLPFGLFDAGGAGANPRM